MKDFVGFIGQGFVGKNLADNFEERGYHVVRYSKEKEYEKNVSKLRLCKIVFIAVPTPTIPGGFDGSTVDSVLHLLKNGTTAVIKSTVPGTFLRSTQARFPKLYILHNPEFLDEKTARHNTDNPQKNIIGVKDKDQYEYSQRAFEVMKILPVSKYQDIVTYEESSYIKYLHNAFFYVKNVFFNLAFDLSIEMNAEWDVVLKGVLAEPRINSVHTKVFDKDGKRGAGGHCLIKDFAVFREMFCDNIEDRYGTDILKSMERRNIAYLIDSNKDMDLVKDVYGRLDNQ